MRRLIQRLLRRTPRPDPAPRLLGMTHAESAAYQARVQRILAATIPDLPPDPACDAAVERIVASGRHSGPNCVEVAAYADGTRRVRNSTSPDKVLEFTADEWAAFESSVRDGQSF